MPRDNPVTTYALNQPVVLPNGSFNTPTTVPDNARTEILTAEAQLPSATPSFNITLVDANGGLPVYKQEE